MNFKKNRQNTTFFILLKIYTLKTHDLTNVIKIHQIKAWVICMIDLTNLGSYNSRKVEIIFGHLAILHIIYEKLVPYKNQSQIGTILRIASVKT